VSGKEVNEHEKIYAIIGILAITSVFAIVGCQKQEAQAPKPAEQSAPASGMTPTAPETAPATK
jgi:hypothetical protein